MAALAESYSVGNYPPSLFPGRCDWVLTPPKLVSTMFSRIDGGDMEGTTVVLVSFY